MSSYVKNSGSNGRGQQLELEFWTRYFFQPAGERGRDFNWNFFFFRWNSRQFVHLDQVLDFFFDFFSISRNTPDHSPSGVLVTRSVRYCGGTPPKIGSGLRHRSNPSPFRRYPKNISPIENLRIIIRNKKRMSFKTIPPAPGRPPTDRIRPWVDHSPPAINKISRSVFTAGTSVPFTVRAEFLAATLRGTTIIVRLVLLLPMILLLVKAKSIIRNRI